MLACLISGMTIPEEDADVGQGSKYCLVAIGRLQVNKKPVIFIFNEGLLLRETRDRIWVPLHLEVPCTQYLWGYVPHSGKDKAEPGDKRGIP